LPHGLPEKSEGGVIHLRLYPPLIIHLDLEAQFWGKLRFSLTMAWNERLARVGKMSGRIMDYEIRGNWEKQNHGFIQKGAK